MTIITDPRTTLHGRLRAARQFAGLEQTDLADALGVARTTVSNWETGKNDIPATAMIRWAELTRISIAWLGFGTVRPEGFEPPAYCSVADDGTSSDACGEGDHEGCNESTTIGCDCWCHDDEELVDVEDLVLAAC